MWNDPEATYDHIVIEVDVNFFFRAAAGVSLVNNLDLVVIDSTGREFRTNTVKDGVNSSVYVNL